MRLFAFYGMLFFCQVGGQEQSPPVQKVEFKKSLQAKTGVFISQKRALYEKPQFWLDQGQVVQVLRVEQNMSLVRTQTDHQGWVDTEALGPLTEKEQRFAFQELTITGYLDNPQAIYILDFVNQENYIRVDKSFVNDPRFMENIVRFEFELENELYYFK